jgi:hypoxanthine phosphoribosyltransferase
MYICNVFSEIIVMEIIRVKDLTFSISIPEVQILERVSQVAQRLTHDLEGKNPLFLCILNGAFMFASDLMKRVNLPAEISFVKYSSYQGTQTTGNVKEIIGLNQDITGRCVVIVEDIIDSGFTMQHLVTDLKALNPAEVHICTLLMKPGNLKVPLDVEYCAMEIPNDFILGYGLDYDGYGRNLPDIYTVVEK